MVKLVLELSKFSVSGPVRLTDSSLKILHLLDHSLPLHSGYAFRTKNIFHAQKKRGWEPVGLTSFKHELAWSGQHVNKENIEGLLFYRSCYTNSVRRGGYLQNLVALAKKIKEVAEVERPHLLHAHSPVLNVMPALWVGRKLGLPVIYEIRAFWEDAAVDHGTYTRDSWKYRVVRGLESLMCKKVDQIAVLCEGLKNDLIHRGISKQKLTVVPNGIDSQGFQHCHPDEELRQKWNLKGKRVIAFIGSFYRYEGLDLLIKAFANLVQNRKDLVLLLVGGGEVRDELSHECQELGIEQQVVMPGRIPHDKIPGVYGLVDLLVYPRISIRLTELVTPLKPLEAMMVKKPLIASDIGGHRELIKDGETGFLFEPGNVEALSSAMKRILIDRELAEQLANQGHMWVKGQRAWEKTTSVYDVIYAQALAAKAS